MIFKLTLEEANAAIKKYLSLPEPCKIVISRPRKATKEIASKSSSDKEFQAVVKEVDSFINIGNRVLACRAIRTYNRMGLKSALAVVDSWHKVRPMVIAAGRFLDPVFADAYDREPSNWV